MVEEGKVALLLGKEVEGICNRVIEDMGECALYWLGVAEKEATVVWVGCYLCFLIEQLDTVYSF